MTSTLIIPGLGDSGPGHWQTWLQDQLPQARRVAQADWGLPDLPAWSRLIVDAIDACTSAPVIVAHSFGVLAAVHAAPRATRRIAGAMLVAPADPDVFGYADQLPKYPLPYPTVLVASRSDPWMSFEAAYDWADRWSARLIDHGHVAHINVDSGHGPWPAGLAIYRDLVHDTRPSSSLRTAAPAPHPRA